MTNRSPWPGPTGVTSITIGKFPKDLSKCKIYSLEEFMELKNVIKFPTKAQRRSYKKKLFSLRTTIDIIIVATGVLLADFVLWVIRVIK